ncbi:AAA family ATPase [Embleya sp. NPDC008237]|uniref:AAA family ATPase n=1 Tax=Embleya sp. NPDC008237 TaxID=3363978 RepID=UPI0036EA6878
MADLVRTRLGEAALTEPVKALVKQALDESETRETSPGGRIYLESVAIARFRGIGPRAFLKLSPRPGVNLVVGRNGSGKSSIAEGIETAFTGVNMRWQGQLTVRGSNWRNLHDADGRPEIEVRLAIEGDTGRSTLTRTWEGDGFGESRAELRRPGHGRVPLEQVNWKQALGDFRPFLSYVDLDRMIGGKPSEMYDSIATVLGLGQLGAAAGRLRQEARALEEMEKAVKAELSGLKEELYELEDDDRAVQALVAVDTAGTPDFATVEALVADLPTDTDDGLLAALLAEADVQGPEMTQVRTAVDRLRNALADVEDLRVTGVEDALWHAEILERGVAHNDRHPDVASCPVCGTDGMLDETWAADAITRIATLRREAEAAAAARSELRSAARAVQDLVHTPRWIPTALTDPWCAWTACRTITDPGELARRAHGAAASLADA